MVEGGEGVMGQVRLVIKGRSGKQEGCEQQLGGL